MTAHVAPIKQHLIDPEICIRCNTCEETCPVDAVTHDGTNYVVGWTAWLDLSPVGVTKASGLEYVARELGVVPADVLAIGDGRNDIEMLRWAGRGVAMGQAVPEVQAAADAVSATVHDDGAAVELERYF